MSPVEPVTAFRDHYSVLGVDIEASAAEIKAAFRELAKRHHPDVNPGVRASRRFAEINEARSVLLSPARRAAFDRQRDAFLRTGVADAVQPRVPEPPPPPRHATPGRALLVAGAVTVLLSLLLLPLATVAARPDPTPVRAFDAGVPGGLVWGAACVLVAALSWPAWRGTLSPGRWEAMLAALVLWLGLELAGQLDPHVLLGGLFSADVAGASGGSGLVLGVTLMLAGTALLRPPGTLRR